MTGHPAAVPWLAHLRTDARGIPVPWINLWGPDHDPNRVAVRWDPHVQARSVFVDDATQTAPDFTRQNMQRQRESVATGRCQVCGRRVRWVDRRLVVGDIGVERIRLHGRAVDVVVEPWLDPRCAELAVRFCPALIRRTRAESLRVLAVTSKRDVQVVLSQGYVDGPLEAATRAAPAVLWAKLALTGPVKVVAP